MISVKTSISCHPYRTVLTLVETIDGSLAQGGIHRNVQLPVVGGIIYVEAIVRAHPNAVFAISEKGIDKFIGKLETSITHRKFLRAIGSQFLHVVHKHDNIHIALLVLHDVLDTSKVGQTYFLLYPRLGIDNVGATISHTYPPFIRSDLAYRQNFATRQHDTTFQPLFTHRLKTIISLAHVELSLTIREEAAHPLIVR